MAAASTSMCSSCTSGNSARTIRVGNRRHSRDVSSTLALSTDVSFPRRATRQSPRPREQCARFHRACRSTGPRLRSSAAAFRRRNRCRRSARGPPARSTPRRTSAFNGDACASGGDGTDRSQVRIEPKLLRRPSSPFSGRSRRARDPLRSADGAEQNCIGIATVCSVESGSGFPVASIAAPPIAASTNSNV